VDFRHNGIHASKLNDIQKSIDTIREALVSDNQHAQVAIQPPMGVIEHHGNLMGGNTQPKPGRDVVVDPKQLESTLLDSDGEDGGIPGVIYAIFL